MASATTKKKRKEILVERMGVHFEQSGFSPMTGRVFAYLLLAEPAHKDFNEIQEFLDASKSAISNALKFLMERQIVTYITFSGDRRRYFKVDAEGWLNHAKAKIEKIGLIKKYVAEVRTHRSDDPNEKLNSDLLRVEQFYNQLTKTMDQFNEDWDLKG